MDEHLLTEAVELLKSRDTQKRMAAVDLAAQLDTAGSTALLIKAIQDQSWSLREYAIRKTALAGSKAVKPLSRLLRDGVWYTRAAALQALELIGDIGPLEAVIALAGDANRSVAEAAHKAAVNLARRADEAALLSLMGSMAADQRNMLTGLLLRSDPALAERLRAHFAGIPPETPGAVSGNGGDEPGTSERLQGLRREFKTRSRQGDRDDNEDL